MSINEMSINHQVHKGCAKDRKSEWVKKIGFQAYFWQARLPTIDLQKWTVFS